jgi:hypothetical protein
MSLPVLPEWLHEGQPVAILDDRYVTGIGSYTETHEATVVKVTPHQIKVRSRTYAGGKEVAFKRDTLKKVGGSGLAATLAHPRDPSAVKARKVAEIGNLALILSISADKAAEALRVAQSPAKLTRDLHRELERLLVTVGKLGETAAATHASLMSVRDELSEQRLSGTHSGT